MAALRGSNNIIRVFVLLHVWERSLLLKFLIFSASPWGMWYLSSPTRDWTHNPCSGRWSLNHWTTREIWGRNLFTPAVYYHTTYEPVFPLRIKMFFCQSSVADSWASGAAKLHSLSNLATEYDENICLIIIKQNILFCIFLLKFGLKL